MCEQRDTLEKDIRHEWEQGGKRSRTSLQKELRLLFVQEKKASKAGLFKKQREAALSSSRQEFRTKREDRIEDEAGSVIWKGHENHAEEVTCLFSSAFNSIK